MKNALPVTLSSHPRFRNTGDDISSQAKKLKRTRQKKIGYKIHGKKGMNRHEHRHRINCMSLHISSAQNNTFFPISLMFIFLLLLSEVSWVNAMGKLFYFQTKCLCSGAGFFIDGKTEPKPHHTQYIVKFPCVHDPRGNDSVFNLQLYANIQWAAVQHL